jgi:acyl-CoA dehydrogenase
MPGMLLDQPPLAHYFTADHEAFRATLRDFVAREITPFADAWDEAGTFPRDLYAKAAAIGAMGIGYDEQYGGTPADVFYKIVSAEEYWRAAAPAACRVAGFAHHRLAAGGAGRQRSAEGRVIPPVLRGDKISALASPNPRAGPTWRP